MAKIRSGVLGNTRGKVSGVVGSQWKDVNYLREYVKPANPNTTAQQTQRNKLSDCVEFCKTLVGPVFNTYTDRFLKSMSGFNYFIKQNIAEFDGSPVYANLKLTEGKLHVCSIVQWIYDDAEDELSCAFTKELGNNGSLTDKCYAACIYTPTGVWYFPDAEVTRNDGSIVFDVPSGLVATSFECYIWFIKYQNTLPVMISDSKHAQSEAPA